MRTLILGGTGMLGHKLYSVLTSNCDGEIFYTKRPEVDALCFDTVTKVISEVRPSAIVNCIGISKYRTTDPETSIMINSVFPHRLARLCSLLDIGLIHLSTDCVFSGNKGNYIETDLPDARDLYGLSKILGESMSCLTLRTSFIGRELTTDDGLFEQFIKHTNGKFKGYTKAIYSGFTTREFSLIVKNLLVNYPKLTGLYHVSSDPISKYELLQLLNNHYHANVDIQPDYSVTIDRSLNSSKFRAITGFKPKSWKDMIEEMDRV